MKNGMNKSARVYTNKLLEMIDEGILDRDDVIRAFTRYLSESDIRDVMYSEDLASDDMLVYCDVRKRRVFKLPAQMEQLDYKHKD